MILEQDVAWLAHYGVKGMKWGVRRSADEIARSRAQKSADKKVKNERKAAAKGRRTASDGDIESLITRLEKERKLKTLVKEDTAPGKKVVGEILGSISTKTVKTVGASAAIAVGAFAVGVVMERVFGENANEVKKNYKIPKPK